MEVLTSVSVKSENACLLLEAVSMTFGGLRAVNRINLSLEHGARRVLLGSNGAGKTTLFNLISGALRPTTGRIFYEGEDITHLPCHRRAGLGIARTFQITNLFPKLTVSENVLIACQASDKNRMVMFRFLSSYQHLTDRAADLLHEFGLWEKRNECVKNLSHGDQRQIEVALALAGHPRLLLLDEPTAGLSPAETHALTVCLKRLDASMTILLIEHDMDVAFEFGDRITVLHQGEILVEGTKEEVKGNPIVQQVYLGSTLVDHA